MIITKSEVMAIPAPAFTKTWHPVSHGNVMTALETILKAEGLGIMNERYTVTAKGHNMFGAWALDIGNGTKVTLGFRNSTCKSFPVGVCSGTHVVVCSNVCFAGDFVEFRKHTGRLDFDQLLEIGGRAIKIVVNNGLDMIAWQESLRERQAPPIMRKVMVYDALAEGIILPSKFNDFQRCYTEELMLAKTSSVYEFHGAITQLYRDYNLFGVANKTQALNTLCNRYLN